MSYDYLPKIYQEIAEVAGLDATLKLAAERGGTRIQVPRRASGDHWLVRVMGETGAQALCGLYGNESVTLPANPAGSVKSRTRRIRQAIAAGKKPDEVALIGGVTVRSVYLLKQRGAAHLEDDGPDLFTPHKD